VVGNPLPWDCFRVARHPCRTLIVVRLVQSQHFDSRHACAKQCFIDRNLYRSAASLGRSAVARIVHENTPDNLCTQSKELHTTLAANALRT